MHTVEVEWLQVFTIVAVLLGVIGVQTTWLIHVLERFEAHVDARFAQIDVRFAQIDERFARIDGRIDRIDGRIDRIEGRIDRIDERFARLEQDVIRDHSQRISRLEARLE